MASTPEVTPATDCPSCKKPEALCVCSLVRELPCRTRILVLQHPQEPDHELGSAWLAFQCLEGARLRIGLSAPNLTSAWNQAGEGGGPIDPSRWGILYLGSGPQGPAPRGARLFWTDKKGVPKSADENAALLKQLQGVVVLDGTWSQAKALWWRNPWVLKLKRLMLAPAAPSLYRELRKEPRKECLSTIESIAEVLDALGENPASSAHLRESFGDLLARYRALKKTGAGQRR